MSYGSGVAIHSRKCQRTLLCGIAFGRPLRLNKRGAHP